MSVELIVLVEVVELVCVEGGIFSKKKPNCRANTLFKIRTAECGKIIDSDTHSVNDFVFVRAGLPQNTQVPKCSSSKYLWQQEEHLEILKSCMRSKFLPS